MQSILDVLGVPKDWTWVQFLNSQFLATFVGAIVAIVVAQVGRRVSEATNNATAAQEAATATVQAGQIEAEQEAVEIKDAVTGEKDYRSESKSLIDEGKKYLDDVASSDTDGRHRRTYEAISRYDYVPLAVALNARKQLAGDQLEAATILFSRWKKFERGRAANKAVPKAVFEEMSSALERLKRPSA